MRMRISMDTSAILRPLRLQRQEIHTASGFQTEHSENGKSYIFHYYNHHPLTWDRERHSEIFRSSCILMTAAFFVTLLYK